MVFGQNLEISAIVLGRRLCREQEKQRTIFGCFWSREKRLECTQCAAHINVNFPLFLAQFNYKQAILFVWFIIDYKLKDD